MSVAVLSERAGAELRAELNALTARLRDLDAERRSVIAAVEGIRALLSEETPEPRLRGARLGKLARVVLQKHGELHYQAIAAQLADSGVTDDDVPRLLTAITRDPFIERIGSRTGRYRYVNGDGPA